MDILGVSTRLKVRQCFQCQGDTEFYCNTCKRDLCLQCKEKHVIDLDIIYHDVVIYREKFDYIPKQDMCVRHPDRFCERFCQPCELPVCPQCLEHRKHQILDIRKAYQIKRQQHRQTIASIRSETLYNCRVLLKGIKTDIKTHPAQMYHYRSQMSTKAKTLKKSIDTLVCNVKTRYRCILTDIIQQQKIKMNIHLTHIQNYEDNCEQSAHRAVQFLLFIKTSPVPHIKDTPKLPLQLCLTERFNTEDINPLLKGIIQIRLTTRKRHVGIEECELHESIFVKGDTFGIYHISRVMSDRVWVSDDNNLILTDTTGDTIHRVTDILPLYRGTHTVNKFGEFLYIDRFDHIIKISADNQTYSKLLQYESPWVPLCLYCSSSNGDLIVGMLNSKTATGTIIRYNSSGQQIMDMQHNDTLYKYPCYITENKNGDIIVSDTPNQVVIVTERGGAYRFSYEGPPPVLSLIPHGICTDALSHILISDSSNNTIHMLDKDGHFLSLLPTKQILINTPYSLNYDDATHLLWVGLKNTRTLLVYNYIQRKYSLTENPGREERIAEFSSSEEVQKSGGELEISEELKHEENSNELAFENCSNQSEIELEISEEYEFEENSDKSKSGDNSQQYVFDDKDTPELGIGENNGVEENIDAENSEESSDDSPESCCQRCAIALGINLSFLRRFWNREENLTPAENLIEILKPSKNNEPYTDDENPPETNSGASKET